ncbi:MAG TPA: hypothetical protein VEK57_22950 [Thermoanaerobaculia bacterium]|nr:hypothetical protein [Thermoanaerobaculia bacterium]
MHHALNASVRLIQSTLRMVATSERCAHRRPVRTALKLQGASGLLVVATARLQRAAEGLAQVNDCIARAPEKSGGVPALLTEATERWVSVAGWLTGAAGQVFGLQEEVLDGIETGRLVPEQPAERRPRIVLVPRPAPVRAFLRARQPRATDRISAILRRRRRSRLPASLRVPRRTSQGRAPPLFPVCLL